MDLSSANIGELTSNNLILSPETVEGLISGTNLDNITITNSEIDSTIIGINSASPAYFTTLETVSDVIFYTTDKSSNVSWDSNLGILTINGDLTVEGCVTIGNIEICKNTINIISNTANGNDINILPNGFGTIYLTGPINNTVNSVGSYITSLADGNFSVIASDYLALTSLSSGSTFTTFSDQNFSTVNGNVNINTDTGLTAKLITHILQTIGNVLITTFAPSEVRIGDIINITGSNSYPLVDGTYTITNVVDTYSFNISTSNIFSGIISSGNIGNFNKMPNNSINLNATEYVSIPTNIPLTFGNNNSSANLNSIYGNTYGMTITSQGDLTFNVPDSTSGSFAGNYNIIIPQSTHFQLGSSGNNYINLDVSNVNGLYDTNIFSNDTNWNSDTSISLNINSNNNITLNATNDCYLNIPHVYFKDQNILLGNYIQTFSDNTDRGIQFNYWSGGQTNGSAQLGWFGFKQSTREFTFYENATNTNDVITGTLSAFAIGSITVNNITLNSGGTFNMGCGQILNTNLITGCGNNLNILANSNINISTSNYNFNVTTAINIPNNIPLLLGTSGTLIKENTNGNFNLTAFKNIKLNTQTNGSIIITPNILLSFDGTSVGNQNIHSDTVGNLIINSNNNIYLTTTSGNIILPSSNSNLHSSIQFENTSNTIYGSTGGIFILSNNSFGNINFIANSNINISNSSGTILINPLQGDIDLFTTQGNVRLYQSSYLIFGITGTVNSIRSNSLGNLMIYGPSSTILTGSIGNTVDIKNTAIINLTASKTINIPNTTQLNIDGTAANRYIVTDTNGNFNINNNITSGTINITSNITNISNTNGSTNIQNNNTNISSNTLTIIGNNSYINTTDIFLQDQNPLIANYTQIFSDPTDRGIQYNYWSGNSNGNTALGWFGIKHNTGEFNYYSTAINNNDVITGTLGTFNMGSVNVNNNITFLTTGNLDMSCGTISNLNTILGCHGIVNIVGTTGINLSASNLMLDAGLLIQMPFSIPLAFGNTTNSIIMSTNGNMTINVSNTSGLGSGTLILNSNVQINGTTNNIYSTITNFLDPILNIGSISGTVPLIDNKDRGIQFFWNNNGTTNQGFFGFQNSTQRFVYYANETNSNEIITGSYGNVQFANGYYNNLDVQCGTIANISLLTACNATGLTIQSTSGINISTNSILLPFNTTINFGNTANSISVTTSGNMNIINTNNTNIISNSGGINLTTNTNGTGYVNISNNSPITFGGNTSGTFIESSGGNLIITNTIGNIYLSPQTNTATSSGGLVIIPINDILAFGSTSTSISSNGTNLALNGYTVSINTSGPTTINGNMNIVGKLTALNTDFGNDKYIYPLGTQQVLQITNIQPGISGTINITTNSQNYLQVGDTAVISNTTNNLGDGTYTVQSIISATTFSVTHSPITDNKGTLTSALMYNQGKYVGIQLDYWQNSTGNGITSGSQYYQTGFFGMQPGTDTFVYYSNASISNNIVTNGTLGNMQINTLYTNNIAGFTLTGALQGGIYLIATNNLQVGGGNIDNTQIGQTTASNGRFTNLASTNSTSLTNVAINGTLEYSIEHFTVSSLQTSYNPSTNTVISYINIVGTGFTGTGIMSSTNFVDGQVKKLIVESCGSTCKYVLTFASGTLLTPNPLGGSLPTTLTFQRIGQSVELMWSSFQNAFIICGGSGAYVN